MPELNQGKLTLFLLKLVQKKRLYSIYIQVTNVGAAIVMVTLEAQLTATWNAVITRLKLAAVMMPTVFIQQVENFDLKKIKNEFQKFFKNLNKSPRYLQFGVKYMHRHKRLLSNWFILFV